MEIYCDGVARIKDKNTGTVFEIDPQELEWACVSEDERGMGPEYYYQAELEHEELGAISWSVNEYPVGAENFQSQEMNGHELIENFNYGLKHVPDFEDWFEYETPEKPFEIFVSSIRDAENILKKFGGVTGDDLINRMVFSQLISAMEAYLSDTLINHVTGNVLATKRLLTQDKELKKQKFSLDVINKTPDLVAKMVREYLIKILYHNLAKVYYLYDIALDIEIFDTKADNSTLFESIEYRHDCIHRNGFDKDGNKLMVFTINYVENTTKLIKSLVRKIESELKNQANSNL
ncbi:MAG: hypothetical protein L3J13_04780 [Devosiaceae bacterium]|nr:hypothetical protein [Devosiaceae bacterium]